MTISVAILASVVIQTYFDKFWCIYYFGDSYINTNNIPVIKTSVNFAIEEDIFQLVKCEGFVIFNSQPTRDVELIESAIHLNPMFSFNWRYYLLIYNNSNDEIFNTSSIFTNTVFESVVNVLLLVEQNDCVEMYTHQYSGSSPLNTYSLGKLCDSYDISALDLYPDKQNNLMGRQLTIATFQFIPYVYLDKNSGAELSVINAFIDKYNYTSNLLITTERWGEVFDNLSGTGVTFDVFTGKADIGVAGFYLTEFDYKVDTTTFALRIGLSYLVPRPQIANGLTTMFKPFRFAVWLMLLGILVVLVITMQFLHRMNTSPEYRYRAQNLTVQFGFIILGSLLQQPMKHRIKVFGVLVIYFGMSLLVTFYSSGYSSLMTKRSFLPHVSTGKDLENSNLPYFVHDVSYLKNVDESMYPNIKRKSIIIEAPELNDYLLQSTTVSIAIDHFILGYAFGDFDEAINISILETFTVLREDISFGWCGFPVYKHSVILPVLDKFIARLRETGLDYYYLAESFRDLNQQKIAYLMKIKQHAKVTQFFNVKTLSGAFLMLLTGLLLATFSFLCEMKKKAFLML